MISLAFLPATEPGDTTYGVIPESLPDYPDITVRHVDYPRLVWYNQTVQDEAIKQIQSWDVAPIVLVGFSKSGLGAWNVARARPDLVSATIIFDAPVAREQLPSWGTSPFYANDDEWQKDLPIRTLQTQNEPMPKSHRLILISGPGFREEMRTFSKALIEIGMTHVFLDRPELKHHWNSGWIEVGLKALRD